MADPVIGGSMEIDFSSQMTRTDDGISVGTDNVGANQDGFPQCLAEFGNDTTTNTNSFVDYQLHGATTIGAGNTATILLDGTLKDRFGDAVTNDKLKVALFAISGPDGTLTCRVGPQSVTGAVTFGMATTGRVDFRYFQPFVDLKTGWAGDKIILNNPGASSITVNWAVAGDRT